MSLDIDRGLISRLLYEGDVIPLKEERISEYFFHGDSRNAYIFIMDCVSNTGEVPTIRVFKNRFPAYKLEKNSDGEVGTDENLKYWIHEIREKERHNRLADAGEKLALSLNSGDSSSDILKEISKSIAFIQTDIEYTDNTALTDNIEDRKKLYIEGKNVKGIVGVPSGFAYLDACLKGFQKETLSTIIAKTSVGKTWFEVLLGSYSLLHGYRVLQFMTEMSETQMRDRYEVTLFSNMRHPISYRLFKSRQLLPKDEQDYFDFLDNDLKKLPLFEFITARSPMQVAGEIDKYKPDIVLIDGVYLMDDDRKAETDTQKIYHITADLKKICKDKHIPIVINSQADKNTSKKTGPEIEDISYAQSIGRDSDNVITLYRTPVMIEDKEMCMRVIKNREGDLGTLTLHWDFEHMNFSPIFSVEANEEKEHEDSFVDI